jgi:glycosyltransferase 2 family protein
VRTPGSGAGRRAWTAARLLGAALILAVLVGELGAGPFLDGLRGLDPGTLLAATAIGAATTVCSAWRWRVVARALGLDLSLSAATAACYRSQFLNCTLPGGVLGDVHRGLRHGVDAGDPGLGLRAVVWERAAGQVVQAALALLVLWALPSPVQTAIPLVALAGAAVAAALLIGRWVVRRGPDRQGRALGRAAAEIRLALLEPTTLPAVLLTSVLVVAGLLCTFLLAARAAGVHGPPQQLIPLALIVLMAAAVPLNVAGWGPREGVAVWVFAAAGWGAGPGAAVATAFGVMTLVATLPGAVVLLVRWLWPGGAEPGRRTAGTPREPLARTARSDSPPMPGRGRPASAAAGRQPAEALRTRRRVPRTRPG